MHKLRKLRQLCFLVYLVGLSLMATACGGSSLSGLKGRVIDPAGNGLADITVLLPGASISVNTAADGTYQIAPLAPRTYTLLVTHDGYIPDNLASANNTVTVEKGKITPIKDIVMKPANELDNVSFANVSPAPQLAVAAETNQNFSFQVNYRLVTAETATISVMVDFLSINRNTYPCFTVTKPIKKGEGTISIDDLTHKIPHGVSLIYTVVIYDGDNKLLAYNTTSGSTISGTKVPSAPSITVVGTDAGVKITWSVEPINFEYIELQRHSKQILRYEREADDPGEYVYTGLTDGDSDYFNVCYKAVDGSRALCSNSVYATQPVHGLSIIPVGGNIKDIYFDNRRNLLYATDYSSSQLLAISPDSGQIIASLATATNPTYMSASADNSWLFIICAQGMITAINLNTLQIHNIPTPQNCQAFAIASYPDGSVIYIVVYKDYTHAVQIYDWKNQKVLQEESITFGDTGKSMVVSHDGNYLYILCSYNTLVLSARDLSIKHSYRHSSKYINVNPNASIPEIYVGECVLKATPPWLQMDRIYHLVTAISPDGHQLYGVNSSSKNNLAIFNHNNISYAMVDNFFPPNMKGRTLAASNAKLYYIAKRPDNTTNDIAVIDLAARQQ